MRKKLPSLLVPCLARATHGADLHAVCGRFHRNPGVSTFGRAAISRESLKFPLHDYITDRTRDP
jgi:hypothetical protein